MEKVVSRDGTEIAFARSGTGPPLVLVHGAAGEHTRWAPILPQLEEHFTVCAVDRRGRGNSGDGPEYSLEREFEDVASVVDSFDEPVNLLGHSLGAKFALEASLLTANIARLILHEPPVYGVNATPYEIIDRLQDLLDEGDREGVLTAMMREVVGMAEEDIELVRGHPSFASRVAVAHTIPRELRAGKEYHFRPERFAGMAIPTLILLGSESHHLNAHSAFLVHQALPNSRLVLMQGVEHVAIYKDPDLVAREVTSFLLEPTPVAAARGMVPGGDDSVQLRAEER